MKDWNAATEEQRQRALSAAAKGAADQGRGIPRGPSVFEITGEGLAAESAKSREYHPENIGKLTRGESKMYSTDPLAKKKKAQLRKLNSAAGPVRRASRLFKP